MDHDRTTRAAHPRMAVRRVLVGPTQSRGRPRDGFTMVEVMVSIGVLLLAVMTAFGSQLTSFRLMTASRESDIAIGDLAACMEELLLLPVDAIPVAASVFAADQPVARYEGLHLRNQRIVASYPDYVVGGAVPDPLQIRLTSTWTDPRGGARRLEVRSLKVR